MKNTSKHTAGKIGVGIIGASPHRGWALTAHVPALKSLPGYEIRAVSTTRRESAEAAARAFGAEQWFDNHQELVSSPKVDLVVVTVKVPHHFELVTAAIAAGKSVYCEWPLGNGLAEAVELSERARKSGVRGAVGLQARSAPLVNNVRDLVRDGYVGEVLSTTLIGSVRGWGPETDQSSSYLVDARNGATLLTIPFGHTVDALCYCLGEFTELTATTATRRPIVRLSGTDETIPMTAADQVAVTAVVEGGAVASLHYRGGLSRRTGLLWEINGTEGDLRLTAPTGHAQLTQLSLFGGRDDDRTLQPLTVSDSYRHVPGDLPVPAVNVAEAYVRLENDLRDGTNSCPTFDDAVQLHRLLAAIEETAATGKRRSLASK
jgi:predicted dehydrogenase